MPETKPVTRPRLFTPNRETPTTPQPVELETTSVARPNLPEHSPSEHKKPRILFSWSSPGRIWKPKSKVWYLSSALVIMLLILVATKLEYYIVILALIAFLFLWFVQGTIEPIITKHAIISQGIYAHGTLIEWKDIKHFWFSKKKNQKLLQIDFIPELKETRMTILVNGDDDQTLFKILLPHISYATAEAAEYNIISKALYGEYMPISNYVPKLENPEGFPPERMIIEG